MVLWVRFEIYDILSQWSHMITLERPMNYKSLVYGLSVKTFLFLPSLHWMVWEPFKLLLLPTTIRATIRALPSAHYHPRTYVNTEGVTGVQFPPILGPAAQTQGNFPAGVTRYLRGSNMHWWCEGHHYVMNIIHFQAQKTVLAFIDIVLFMNANALRNIKCYAKPILCCIFLLLIFIFVGELKFQEK